MGLIRRFGFAAVVVAALALMTVFVIGKSLLGGGGDASASAGAGASAAAHSKGGAGPIPQVLTVAASQHTFSDAIQALGTAQARESIVLTPKVADTIRAIRFESGQQVRQGQVLVEMSSVEQAADLAEAHADNEAAQQDLHRYQELFNRGFASQARLDATQAAADAAQARVNAGASRTNDRTIRAPFAGVVGLRTASPGQYMQPGQQIGTLDDTAVIKLDFDVPETQISRVAVGVAIVAHTAAYPDRTFTGTIATVDSRIDPATRTVRVRAMLPNGDGQIRPGMLMTVQVQSNPRSGLAVPEIALIDQADGAYVYRVNTEGGAQMAEQVKVQTGQRVSGVAEILSGLNDGDAVVTQGLQSLHPHQAVHASPDEQDAEAAGDQPGPAAVNGPPTLRPRT